MFNRQKPNKEELLRVEFVVRLQATDEKNLGNLAAILLII